MFDPYHKWLGIPREQQPPTYYQLLGIAATERDAEVIEEAVIRQTAHVRTYQLGPHSAECTRLLNEIAEARATLLNPAKRKAYNARLAARARAMAGRAATAITAAPTAYPAPVATVAAPVDPFADIDVPGAAPPVGPGRTRVAPRDGRSSRRLSAAKLIILMIGFGALALVCGGGIGVLVLMNLAPTVSAGTSKANNFPTQSTLLDSPSTSRKDPTSRSEPTSRRQPETKPETKPVDTGRKPDPGKPDPGKPDPGKPTVPVLREVRSWQGDKPWGPRAALSPDGKFVITLGKRTTLYDVKTGQEIPAFGDAVGMDPPMALAFAPNSKLVAGWSIRAKTIHLWEVPSGKEVGKLLGHTAPVNSLVFTADGEQLLSGGLDLVIRIWDYKSQKEPQTLEGHTKAVLGIAVTPDGKRALSNGYDGTLRVWDLEQRKELHSVSVAHSSSPAAIAPDGQKAVTSFSANRQFLALIDLKDYKASRLVPSDGRYNCMVYSPDGKYLITGCGLVGAKPGQNLPGDCNVRVFDVATWKEVCRSQDLPSAVYRIAVSADGRLILSVTEDCTVTVWALTNQPPPEGKP